MAIALSTGSTFCQPRSLRVYTVRATGGGSSEAVDETGLFQFAKPVCQQVARYAR